MIIKDNVTQLEGQIASYGSLTADGTLTGEIIDTGDYDAVAFFPEILAYTDGSYTFTIYEGAESDMSDAAEIDSDKIIGSTPTLTAADSTATALNKFGVFSNKRYLRIDTVGASLTSGATIAIHAMLSRLVTES